MGEKTYRIGEAAEMLQLKSYVLRFWETEFAELTPLRTEKGQRLYTQAHIVLLRRIQHLLHERGMTIDGARRILATDTSKAKTKPVAHNTPTFSPQSALTQHDLHDLRDVRDELMALRELLRTRK